MKTDILSLDAGSGRKWHQFLQYDRREHKRRVSWFSAFTLKSPNGS